MSSPSDVVMELDAIADRKVAESQELARTQADADVLKVYVEKNANPSPAVITLIVIGVLIAVWLFYVLFLAPNASGEWYDTNGNMIVVEHCRLTGRAECNNSMKCEISDNLVSLDDRIGVWDYDNVILFVGGGSLVRVRE